MPWSITTTGLAGVRQRYELAQHITGQTIAKVFTTRLTEAVAYARERYRTGGTTSDRTAVRTGALRAALGMRVEASGASVKGVFGYVNSPVPYASMHEGWPDNRSSTTIRPTHGKYLAIPLAAAKTAAGVPRGGPRDFADTFIRGGRGGLIIFQRQGKNVVPLFLLRTSVVVPARPALSPTLQRFLPLIVSDLEQSISQGLKG